jgi:hypothetical protein
MLSSRSGWSEEEEKKEEEGDDEEEDGNMLASFMAGARFAAERGRETETKI